MPALLPYHLNAYRTLVDEHVPIIKKFGQTIIGSAVFTGVCSVAPTGALKFNASASLNNALNQYFAGNIVLAASTGFASDSNLSSQPSLTIAAQSQFEAVAKFTSILSAIYVGKTDAQSTLNSNFDGNLVFNGGTSLQSTSNVNNVGNVVFGDSASFDMTATLKTLSNLVLENALALSNAGDISIQGSLTFNQKTQLASIAQLLVNAGVISIRDFHYIDFELNRAVLQSFTFTVAQVASFDVNTSLVNNVRLDVR